MYKHETGMLHSIHGDKARLKLARSIDLPICIFLENICFDIV